MILIKPLGLRLYLCFSFSSDDEGLEIKICKRGAAPLGARAFSGSPTRQLAASGGDGGGSEDKPSWWQRGPFKKPSPEQQKAKEEKHEILMERLRRSTFYDAKQAPDEKVGGASFL